MDDLISRQGAINKCRKRLYESAVNNVGYKCNADEVFVDIAENRIETWLNELPFTQPERMKGEWIKPNRGLCEADFIRCSLCGFLSHPMVVRWDMGLGLETIGKLELPYECPKCHADMRGEQNGND